MRILIFAILIGIVAPNDKLEQLETLIHDLKQENDILKKANHELAKVLDEAKIGTPVIFSAVRKSALGEYNHVQAVLTLLLPKWSLTLEMEWIRRQVYFKLQ